MPHTPGPWQVSKHATPDYAPQFGICAEGLPNDLAMTKGENAKANAALISVAPDAVALLIRLHALHGHLFDKETRALYYAVINQVEGE